MCSVQSFFSSVRQKYALLFGMLILAFLMTGCGKEETEVERQDFFDGEEIIYVADYPNLLFEVTDVAIWKNNIYCVSKNNEIYRLDSGDLNRCEKLDIMLSNEEGFQGQNVYTIEKVQPGPGGKLYLFVRSYEIDSYSDEMTRSVSLAAYDPQDSNIKITDVTSLLDSSSVRATAVDSAGNLFFLSGENAVHMYDYETQETVSIKTEKDLYIGGMDCAKDGSIYVSTLTYSYNTQDVRVCTVSEEKGVSDPLFDNFCNGNGFALFGDAGFLTSCNNSLYFYDTNIQENSQLTSWMNLGLDASAIQACYGLEDSRILVFFYDSADTAGTGQLAVVSPVLRSEYAEKQTISVGTFYASNALNHAVSKFNRKNSQYRVEVKEYYDYLLDTSVGGIGKQEAVQRFHMDIISGKCPDIINLEREDLEQYAEKGLFADLEVYLKAQSALTFSDTLKQAYTYSTGLAALPANIQLRTISGKVQEDSVGENWTLEEMMAFVEEQEGQNVFEASPATLLEYCLQCNMDRFVNRDKRTCDFTNQEFMDVLTFCKKYGKPNAERYGLIYSVWYQPEAVLHEVTIKEPDALSFLTQEYRGKKFAFPGFPNNWGTGGTILEEVGGCYSIYDRSDRKDAAWEFLALLFSDVQKTTFYNLNNGFPAAEESLEAFFTAIDNAEDKKHGRASYSTDIDGLVHYVPAQAELEELRIMIETAIYPTYYDGAVMEILQEEAAYYLEGNKPMDEVVSAIQNRIKLYLSE